MIPAPRFDYQAAATPGGIYQGLGALAGAASEAFAVNRKAKQDQAIAEQAAMREERKHQQGLARIAAQDAQYERTYTGQQDAANRTAQHQNSMLGIAQQRLQNEQEHRMNPPARQAPMLSPEDQEYRRSLTERNRAETERLKNQAPPLGRPPTPAEQIRMDEIDADAYAAQEVEKWVGQENAARAANHGGGWFSGAAPTVNLVERSQRKDAIRTQRLAELQRSRNKTAPQGGVSGLPQGRSSFLRQEALKRFGGQLPAEVEMSLQEAENGDTDSQDELEELLMPRRQVDLLDQPLQ